MSESTTMGPVRALATFADSAEKKSDRWLFLFCFVFIITASAGIVIYTVRQNQFLISRLELITADQIAANRQMAVALDRNTRALEGHSTASVMKDDNGHN